MFLSTVLQQVCSCYRVGFVCSANLVVLTYLLDIHFLYLYYIGRILQQAIPKLCGELQWRWLDVRCWGWWIKMVSLLRLGNEHEINSGV